MTVINMTRSSRIANETGISGSEAMDVDNTSALDQQISASTEEEVTELFQAYDLQSLSMICDQAVEVMVLETRFAILQTANAAPSTITHTGDLEQEIFVNDLIRVEGTVADDGVYLVDIVNEAAGTTTISLALGNTFPVAGGGAVGTVCKIASAHRQGYSYTIATAAVTGVITITGDVSDKFAIGDFVRINSSTGNDGFWEITAAVTTDGPPVTTTTLTLNSGVLPDATNDGVIEWAAAAFSLAANTPFLWSIDGGLQNPLVNPEQNGISALWNTSRGNIVAFMVDNTATAIAAQFDARIGINSNIF